MTLTFVLPMPPNISNGAHGHWAARYGQKGSYERYLDAIQAVGAVDDNGTRLVVPPPPKHAFARCAISSTMHLGNAMDDSNAMRRHKWVEDWLKTRGYIADDRKKCLTWAGFPEQIVKRDGNYRLVLTLTERTA